MKKTVSAMAFLAVAITFISCSKDDESISGTGNLGVEFDNAFKTNDLILGQSNTTSNGEHIIIGNIKYIISNIVLTNEDGTTFTYPKGQSYFIVDESDEDTHVLELANIPAGNYVKVSFGVGVDQEQYNIGQSAQTDFLGTATSAGLVQSWDSGYDSLLMTGQFTSASVSTATDFAIQTRKTATQYNYTPITLDLPTKALVRTNISPEIHIIVDDSKTIDGTNKIALSDHVTGGTATITDDSTINAIVANFAGMFTVAHVHND